MSGLRLDKNAKKIVPIAIVMFAGIVLASVFVYNPITGRLVTTTPAIIFQPGANAGQADLGNNNTITVSLSPSQTSASVLLHPTYQKTYYKDILEVNNTDANTTYYILLRVTDPLDDAKVVEAFAYLKDTGGTLLATLDLTVAGTETVWIPIPANTVYIIDFSFVISDGAGDSPNTAPSLTDTQFAIDLIYSTSGTEAAP
ncbi:MAG: hypothetical protein GSR84_06730 [Desulfurococcales archaeon]|nr:hypothetical protein [Desulfurococcales archaeon]